MTAAGQRRMGVCASLANKFHGLRMLTPSCVFGLRFSTRIAMLDEATSGTYAWVASVGPIREDRAVAGEGLKQAGEGLKQAWVRWGWLYLLPDSSTSTWPTAAALQRGTHLTPAEGA